jgi:hypothetical protein
MKPPKGMQYEGKSAQMVVDVGEKRMDLLHAGVPRSASRSGGVAERRLPAGRSAGFQPAGFLARAAGKMPA